MVSEKAKKEYSGQNITNNVITDADGKVRTFPSKSSVQFTRW